MVRCFIAVDMRDELRSKIVKIQEQIAEPAIKPVEEENLHITLKFLGELTDQQLDKVKAALSCIKYPKFDVSVGTLGVFPNINYIRVIWLGLKGPLETLAKDISQRVEPLVDFRDSYGFSSHLTIGRVKGKPSAELTAKIEDLKDIQIGKQHVTNFVLKKSTLTPNGPIYEDIESYELI